MSYTNNYEWITPLIFMAVATILLVGRCIDTHSVKTTESTAKVVQTQKPLDKAEDNSKAKNNKAEDNKAENNTERARRDQAVTQSVARSTNKAKQNTLATHHDTNAFVLIACAGGWIFCAVLLGTLYSSIKLTQTRLRMRKIINEMEE